MQVVGNSSRHPYTTTVRCTTLRSAGDLNGGVTRISHYLPVRGMVCLVKVGPCDIVLNEGKWQRQQVYFI